MIHENKWYSLFGHLPVPRKIFVGAAEEGRGTAGMDGDAAGVKVRRLHGEDVENFCGIFCGQR